MSRNKIIEVAASQLGVSENPPRSNRTPFGKWYGWDGYAWCAMFVSWVYDKAGHPLGRINDDKGFRDCHSAYHFWKRSGEFTSDPKEGDIVLFDWNNDGRSDHTGIFKQWLDDKKQKFSAYEGNTALGNNRDGGSVMLRQDRNMTFVTAFVSPKILGDAAAPVPEVMRLAKDSKGAAVAQLQKMLHDLDYDVTVDGIFGNETLRVLKKFQKEHKLPVTGEADEPLLKFIESRLMVTIDDKKAKTGSYLTVGDSGGAVLKLQQDLNKAGTKPRLPEDGVFGPKTLVAVKAFQRRHNLVADGIAGPQTLGKL